MKKIFLYTLLTLLITISCSPDLGNYKYRDLIEPHITGIDSEMTVLTYSDLVIKPSLGISNISDDDYSYEWKAINIDTNYDQRTYILSEEKDLNYNIDILPGNYLLVFTVTEKSTGIFWQAQSDLRVTQTTSEGWLALCNVNGETRLDMYSVITESLYTDLLKNSGLPSVMRGPRKIYRLKNNFSDTESPFYLLTDDGDRKSVV